MNEISINATEMIHLFVFLFFFIILSISVNSICNLLLVSSGKSPEAYSKVPNKGRESLSREGDKITFATLRRKKKVRHSIVCKSFE